MFQGAYVILDGAPHRNTRDVCVCERDAIKKIDRKRKRKANHQETQERFFFGEKKKSK